LSAVATTASLIQGELSVVPESLTSSVIAVETKVLRERVEALERQLVAVLLPDQEATTAGLTAVRIRVEALERQLTAVFLPDQEATTTMLFRRLERLRVSEEGRPVLQPDDQMSRTEVLQVTLHLAMLLAKFAEHEKALKDLTNTPHETIKAPSSDLLLTVL